MAIKMRVVKQARTAIHEAIKLVERHKDGKCGIVHDAGNQQSCVAQIIADLKELLPQEASSRLSAAKIYDTSRGFERIDFVDHYGEKCSLHQSSLADYEPPGSSAVWLGVGDERMHLDRNSVHALIGYLSRWLSKGSFKE